MDPLSQGLLGAVSAQLGFRQKIGKDTTWFAGLAATTPDLDVFSGPIYNLLNIPYDEFTELVTHRGLSHSLFFVPIIALITTAIWWQCRKLVIKDRPPGSLKWMYSCMFVAILTHPLLDWCTSYGTQLLAPFSRQRFALDIVPIIDFIYTPILLLTILTCAIIRIVKKDSIKITLVVGWIGFGLSLAYLTCGYVFHEKAISHLKYHTNSEQGSYNAYPFLGSIFVWRTTCQNNNQWITARVNVLHPKESSPTKINVSQNIDNQWAQEARNLEQIKIFDWFTNYHLRADYKKELKRHIIYFHDMRYGLFPESSESLWGTQVILDTLGNCISINRTMNPRLANGFSAGDLANSILDMNQSP